MMIVERKENFLLLKKTKAGCSVPVAVQRIPPFRQENGERMRHGVQRLSVKMLY